MSKLPALTRREVIESLPGEFGQKVIITPWWSRMLDALDLPTILMLLIVLVRQAGKTQAVLSTALSELLTRRNAYVVVVGAAEHQAQATYERKLRAPLRALLRAHAITDSAIRFTKHGVEVPALNSTLEIVPSNEATVPGRTPTLLIFDEAKDIPDATFVALVPSVIGAGGKVIVVGTPGAPKGFFYDLVQQAPSSPEIWLHHSGDNENPHASAGVLDFLKRKLGVMFPSAMRRELEAEFTESGEELIPAGLIEASIDDSLGEIPEHDGPASTFVDIGRKRDITSAVTVVRVAARQPEMTDHLITASVMTWSPSDFPTGETDFAVVRQALDRLPRRFPNLRKLFIDEGAEAGSILPWARAHDRLSLVVEGFTGSVASNMELWGSLVARLNARTISIPRHERLIAELRGLRREEFAFGSKWRVVDGSKKFHRDVSLSLAGAAFAARVLLPPRELEFFGAINTTSRATSSQVTQEIVDSEWEARLEASRRAIEDQIRGGPLSGGRSLGGWIRRS